MRRRIFFAAALAAIFAAAGAGRADSVKLAEGKILEGNVSFAGGAVRVESGGKVRVLKLGEVAEVEIRKVAATAAGAGAWEKKEFGVPEGDGGSCVIAGDRVEIREHVTGVRNKGGSYDRFYFACQKLEGDGELAARVFCTGRRSGRAGLMVRGSLESNAPMVFLSREAGGGPDAAVCQMRAEKGRRTEEVGVKGPAILGAAYLKLARAGDRITASESADGKKWTEIGQAALPLAGGAWIGMASGVGTHEQAGLSVFDKVALGAGGRAGGMPMGVMTRGGSFAASERVEVKGGKVFFRRGGEDRSLPLADVARLLVRPVTAEMAEKLAGASAGVMQPSGDWVEGEVKGVEGGQVLVSSVVFGLTKFDMERKVAAIVWRGVAEAKGGSVRAADGSVWRGKVSLDGGDVVVEDAALGAMRVKGAEVRGVRRGGE